MKEITIVGGGLAGLSLGICLRKKGIPVRLIESTKYPRHRVCGEFIAGVSDHILEDLGIHGLLADARKHREMKWWMGDSCLLSEQTPSVAFGISRYVLDERLAKEFVGLGGVLEYKIGVKFKDAEQEGWVWAAGKDKRRSKQDVGGNAWIGLKIHAVGLTDAESAGLEMHSGKTGYLGLCPVENGRVNCCGLFQVQSEITPASAKRKWGAERGKVAMLMSYAEAGGMTALLEWLQSNDFDDESFTAIAGFRMGEQTLIEEGEVFCIGDASYLIPPFTGNGMSMALESSAFAAKAIENYSLGALSWSDCLRAYRNETRQYFSKRTTIAEAIHPLFFHPLGQLVLKAVARSGFPSFNSLFKLLRTP